MSNKLNTRDMIDSIRQIEKDCELGAGFGKVTIDHAKFYERVKGLIALAENIEPKPGSGAGGMWC
jgi:hypothetical protein